MNDLVFFRVAEPLSLASVAALGQASLPSWADPTRPCHAAMSLERAGPGDVAAFTEDAEIADLEATRAGACFVTAGDRHLVPSRTVTLLTEDPREAFRVVAMKLHPESVRPGSMIAPGGIDAAAIVHRAARLEPDVTIDPGVVVGPRTEIGAGTSIGANSTIGADVRIGRDCSIDTQVSISHALIGDRVVIHAGARIGQGGAAHPALGRVIIQNGVEIGANVAIARGITRDTIIGEGRRIEALSIIEAEAMIDRCGPVGTV